jgi:hypothetical protein
VQLAALAAHALGGAGLILGNKMGAQQGEQRRPVAGRLESLFRR